MNSEFDRALYKRHPNIFADRHLPESLCPMGRGLDIGDGWHCLVDTLCAALQRETDCNVAPQVVATQVKEKLGGLRFYVREASGRQRTMIDAAVELSMHVCDRCGSPGRLVHFIHGGIATRCALHGADGLISDQAAR